ncbi:MAG: F0F1 ATP synthase subunit epsilon [Defluviitaleaceae bacterium]|nr:F0F1 ATP synthase subunit epsilon [Defluviitaleaceae bacterium]
MADKKIEVRILTPHARTAANPYKYQAEVNMVIVRTTTGDRGFLPGHEACSVVLDAGILRIITGADAPELKLAVLGGIAQMDEDVLTVITETAEWPEEIDRARAAAARDDLVNRITKAESVEMDGLKKELRAADVLMAVGAMPPSGVAHEK